MEENERREGVLKQHFALYAKKPSMKDCFVTVFIFMICTIIGLLFQKLHFTDIEYRYECISLACWSLLL